MDEKESKLPHSQPYPLGQSTFIRLTEKEHWQLIRGNASIKLRIGVYTDSPCRPSYEDLKPKLQQLRKLWAGEDPHLSLETQQQNDSNQSPSDESSEMDELNDPHAFKLLIAGLDDIVEMAIESKHGNEQTPYRTACEAALCYAWLSFLDEMSV